MRRALRRLAWGVILAAILGIAQGPPLVITTNSLLPQGTVGISYATTLNATGGFPPYTWDTNGLPLGLNLDKNSGTISGTPTMAGIHNFVARVIDFQGLSALKTFQIQINPPPSITTASPLPSGTTGTRYSQQLAATGGTGALTWSLAGGNLPAGLAFSASGVISGTPEVPATSNFTVRVTDQEGAAAQKAFDLTINPPPLVITTSALAGGTVGVAYAQTLTATGGVPGYGWSISAGTLPAGLTLDGLTGFIGGAPTAPGTSSFTVRVTDRLETSVTRALNIVVSPAPIVITTVAPLPSATVATAYSQALAATGGTPPYRWSVSTGSLPPGLALDPNSGVVSGTPTREGTFNFIISANDAGNLTGSKSFSITVNPQRFAITTAACPNATVGTAYTCALSAAGGLTPFTWSVSAGALPPGLTLTATNGVVSGTPSVVGTFTFTAAVADSSGGTATRVLSITVNPPPLAVTSATCPNGVTGAAYSCILTANGGTPPYNWTISAGALPPGLTLGSATGVISGTPTTAGASSFTVVVSDSTGATATRALSLTVTLPVLAITNASCPGGSAGVPYSCILTATGGTPPYTWSLSAGALPAGLTLAAATGIISGVSTATGFFNFTALVTDSARGTASRAFTLAIERPSVSAPAIRLSTQVIGPAQQPTVGISSDSPAPGPLTGDLELRFTPDAVVPADDPNIQFIDPATMRAMGRTAQFTIAAGSTQGLFGAAAQIPFQSGTVAGTITLVVTRLLIGGFDVTPSPAPTVTIQLRRAAPVLTSVTIANRTATSFQVLAVGYATARAVAQAVFRFVASGTGNLQTTTLTVEVGPVFTTWYQGAASAAFGSQFALTGPFTVTGEITAIRSVSVTLVNADGTSNAIEANLP